MRAPQGLQRPGTRKAPSSRRPAGDVEWFSQELQMARLIARQMRQCADTRCDTVRVGQASGHQEKEGGARGCAVHHAKDVRGACTARSGCRASVSDSHCNSADAGGSPSAAADAAHSGQCSRWIPASGMSSRPTATASDDATARLPSWVQTSSSDSCANVASIARDIVGTTANANTASSASQQQRLN